MPGDHPTAPRAGEGPRVIHVEADLDAVARYYAQGYELGAELLSVEYAITDSQPRRMWFRLTVREHLAPLDEKEGA